MPLPSPPEPSLLTLYQKKILRLVELDPPKHPDLTRYLHAASELEKSGADALTLADNSLALLRVSNLAAATAIRSQSSIPLILHLTCRDKNLIALQSEALGRYALGFRHVLALTGDSPKLGDHPNARPIYELNSITLIRTLHNLNQGHAASGKSISHATQFIIGCAFNPNTDNLTPQLRKLDDKLSAGAHFIMTQPLYSVEKIRNTATLLAPYRVPVFIGVMPILHSRNAEFLHSHVPGISIPDSVREKFRHLPETDAWRFGVEYALTLQKEILQHFPAVYLITPFLRYETTQALLQAD
ncbi:MAG: methylenetetrahydrofolate reductase [Methylacidiphilales bacterium]|nr:methylenetetrahydrofolate reductase [Candidatus Methylacidiphilales bacterium]MDW8349373.1 methylenetetrahydrofolate reductase [Verrucomicrobiae bacterium]